MTQSGSTELFIVKTCGLAAQRGFHGVVLSTVNNVCSIAHTQPLEPEHSGRSLGSSYSSIPLCGADIWFAGEPVREIEVEKTVCS